MAGRAWFVRACLGGFFLATAAVVAGAAEALPVRGVSVRPETHLAAPSWQVIGGMTAVHLGISLAYGSSTCTTAQKTRYEAAAGVYGKRMLRDRVRYFKAHKRAKLRAAFVKTQRAKLKALRLKAQCDDSSSPEQTPPPIALNPAPSANETFDFGPGMSPDAQAMIKGDVAFAAEDESRLVGLVLGKITVFASTDATWLAGRQCGFYGDRGSCVSEVAARYASGNSTAQGGPGAVFLYWASPSWQYGAATNQKIIAHELFHVLQYETDNLNEAGRTPFDQVRPTGPVWLDEGAPEMLGYRVMADRKLGSYATAISNEIGATKQIGTPLNGLERLSQTGIPNVYSLFALSVDHLVEVAPTGLSALATYYRALGAGSTWPDAFRQAFGMGVADYYMNFAEYRGKL